MDKSKNKNYEWSSNLLTTDDANLLLSELDDYLQGVFTGDLNSSKFNKTFTYNDKKIVEVYLKENGGELDEKNLKRLADEVKGFDKVEITLSFLPTQNIVNEISRWFSSNLDNKVILDINVDSSIMGGAIIKYKGLFRDFSLKKEFSKTTK